MAGCMLVSNIPKTARPSLSLSKYVVIALVFHNMANIFCLKLNKASTFPIMSDLIQCKNRNKINKLTSVFYASVLLLIMNFVITLSK